jgi:signal transduction histidine kinase
MLVLTAVLAWAGQHFTGLARESRQAGRGDLASRVAHEIRNPLTAIKMQLQLLEEKAADGDAERIRKLLDEIRRMEMIVESALTIGAPLTLHRSTLQPATLIAELGELVQPSLAHRGIELQLAPACPVSVEGDPDRLRQALINLINNAADELAAGGIVRLGASADPDGRFVDLVVEDSGPGLRDGKAAFESDKPFGLGLGLTICREIASHHGGELIAADSAELGGAKFTIRLPAPIIERHDHAG